VSTPTLDPDQRRVLGALADVLIPRSETMPSATDVDVETKWIDRALAVRSDLVGTLAGVLDRAATSDPAAELARLERDDAETLESVQLLVAGAYYMSPRVRKLLGYPGQSQRPILPDEADHYLEGDLLAPVVARGKAYRSLPTSTGNGAASDTTAGAANASHPGEAS
jgi:hypothetical protein